MKTEEEIKAQMDDKAHDYLDCPDYGGWYFTKGWLAALKWVIGD